MKADIAPCLHLGRPSLSHQQHNFYALYWQVRISLTAGRIAQDWPSLIYLPPALERLTYLLFCGRSCLNAGPLGEQRVLTTAAEDLELLLQLGRKAVPPPYPAERLQPGTAGPLGWLPVQAEAGSATLNPPRQLPGGQKRWQALLRGDPAEEKTPSSARSASSASVRRSLGRFPGLAARVERYLYRSPKRGNHSAALIPPILIDYEFDKVPSMGVSTAHLAPLYQALRDWLRVWPFRPVIVNRHEYMVMSAMFPRWLPPISLIYEAGIPNIATFFKRAVPGEELYFGNIDPVYHVTAESIASCILRARHDGILCRPLEELARTSLLEEVAQWLDNDIGDVEDGCAICGSPSHGKDFAHVRAQECVTLNLPAATVMSDICSIKHIPHYKFIRYAIHRFSSRPFPELSPPFQLMRDHVHATEWFSYPSSPATAEATAAGAAFHGLAEDIFVKFAIIAACAEIVDSDTQGHYNDILKSSTEDRHER